MLEPYSQEIEQTLIGSILFNIDNLSKIRINVTDEDFYFRQHAEIYKAIIKLNDDNQEINTLSLVQEMKRTGMFNIIGGSQILFDCELRFTNGISIKYLITQIINSSKTRKLIQLCNTVSQACLTNDSVEQSLAELESGIYDISEDMAKGHSKKVSEMYQDVVLEIVNRKEGIVVPYLTTGVKDIDDFIGGIGKEDLVYIAGRPGMAKTTMALYLSLSMAKKKDKVLFFSLEMPKEDIMERLISNISLSNFSDIKSGNINEQQEYNIMMAKEKIDKLDLTINDTPNLSVAQIQSICEEHKRKNGLDIIFIDYIRYISPRSTDSKADTRTKFSNISHDLVKLKRRLKMPVVCLSQISRPQKHIKIPLPPTMSDLKESGSLEEDANKIILLHREGFYNSDAEDASKTQIIIAKDRSGKTGEIEMEFVPEFMCFNGYNKRY